MVEEGGIKEEEEKQGEEVPNTGLSPAELNALRLDRELWNNREPSFEEHPKVERCIHCSLSIIASLALLLLMTVIVVAFAHEIDPYNRWILVHLLLAGVCGIVLVAAICCLYLLCIALSCDSYLSVSPIENFP